MIAATAQTSATTGPFEVRKSVKCGSSGVGRPLQAAQAGLGGAGVYICRIHAALAPWSSAAPVPQAKLDRALARGVAALARRRPGAGGEAHRELPARLQRLYGPPRQAHPPG